MELAVEKRKENPIWEGHLQNFSVSCSIWFASSRVGAMINANGPSELVIASSLGCVRMYSRRGIKKAQVLPEPLIDHKYVCTSIYQSGQFR